MINNYIHGYGICLNQVFADLAISNKISDLDVKLLDNLINHPNQLENAVDNANTNLAEHKQPTVKLAIQDNYIGTPAFIYYPSVMPYAKTYNKDALATNIKCVICDMLWSEYSAPIANGNYPIKESEFIAQTINNIPDSEIVDLDLDI